MKPHSRTIQRLYMTFYVQVCYRNYLCLPLSLYTKWWWQYKYTSM